MDIRLLVIKNWTGLEQDPTMNPLMTVDGNVIARIIGYLLRNCAIIGFQRCTYIAVSDNLLYKPIYSLYTAQFA